jgi:hypothetical protein
MLRLDRRAKRTFLLPGVRSSEGTGCIEPFLHVAKGLPADDDQSAAVGHGADVDLTAGPNVGELGSTTEEDDDLENFRGF